MGEGPCLAAYEAGEAIAIPDLREEGRFPGFTPLALKAGLVAVFTFPLRQGDARLGALDLYRQAPGPLDADAMAATQTLADMAPPISPTPRPAPTGPTRPTATARARCTMP